MNLDQLYDMVELRFPELTEPLFLDIVNQVQMQFVSESKCLEDIQSTLSVSGQRLYDVPEEVMQIIRVDFDGARIEAIQEMAVAESSFVEADPEVVIIIHEKDGI
jgi:hypothetical protein